MIVELYRRIEDARDLLADRFDEPLRLEDAAREACLSPFHFHRLFVRTYGQTPHEFLTQRRIEEAKRLLAKSDLTVTEICFSLGYESLGTFSSRFRQLVGCSPSDYRIGAARFYAISRIRAHRFVPTCFVAQGMRGGMLHVKPQESRSGDAAPSSIVGER